MALGDDARPQIGRHLGFGAALERDAPGLQFGGDAIDRGTCCGERGDFGSVLARAQFVHHRGGAHVAGAIAAPVTQQVDEETGPHRVAHGGHGRARHEAGHQRHRVVGFVPRQQREHTGLRGHTWCFEARDDHGGFGVAGHHQHGEPFERHGRVAGEVWQVAAHAEQQHIDPGGIHGGPGAGDAVEEGAGGRRRAHASILADSATGVT